MFKKTVQHRITGRLVVSRLKKKKRIPAPGYYNATAFLYRKEYLCACALGSIYGRNGPDIIGDYENGVIAGWDGGSPKSSIRIDFNEEEYLKGFCDGVQAHVDALKAFGLLGNKPRINYSKWSNECK